MMARLAAAAVALLAVTLSAQSPALSEAQRVEMLEESNTNLYEAAALYMQGALQATIGQLAATAHLRVGLLYGRLG